VSIGLRWRQVLYLACTFLEAVSVIAFNRVRRKLGFKPPPDSTNMFLRLFLLHALRRQPKIRITCRERNDGAGAQAHTIMSAMNFARSFGHTYVHTPFTEIDHGDRPMEAWVEAWENLFNLGQNEERCDARNPREINYSTFHPRLYHAVCNALLKIGRARSRSKDKHAKKEFIFHPFFYFSDSHPESYVSLIPDLRKKYYRDRSPAKNRLMTVAVHMRRGDVTREHRWRFTPVDKVCETIRLVKSLLETHQQDHRISLYSQGEAGEFEQLKQFGAELFLDADAIWTMQQLIEADILIMSKSSFSYVAALISDGILVYEPFWHSPLSQWISLNRRGKFNTRTFSNQLERLIAGRANELN